MSGLVDYRHQRQQEICERATSQDGICFHDGEKVLGTVKNMHERLLRQGEIRPGDHVTRPVLKQMITDMLDEDPDLRLDAIKMWKKSQKILDEAEKKLEKSNQQINLSESVPVGSNAQYYDPFMPTTPPQTSYGALQASHGNTHSHGPPPTRSRHSSNYATSGRPPFLEQRLGRSGTWHGHHFISDMASSSLHGSPSPPIANHRSLGPSPPVGTYSDVQERSELHGATFDPSNSLKNDRQSVRDFPPSENNIDASFLNFPQPAPMTFQDNRTPVELPALTKKPEKPYLSFESARQIRIQRGTLRREHQDLLNDLKNRDHVSP
jgi:hypothetical protein